MLMVTHGRYLGVQVCRVREGMQGGQTLRDTRAFDEFLHINVLRMVLRLGQPSFMRHTFTSVLRFCQRQANTLPLLLVVNTEKLKTEW